MTPISSSTRVQTLWSIRGVRLAAASLMVVGGIMAATSAMKAWAGPMHGEAGGVCMHGTSPRQGGGMGPMMLGGRGLDRLLDQVKATDVQRQQIRQIADAARQDLDQQHQGMRKLHEQSLTLLSQPKLDAGAAEKLRQQMLAQHDAVSKRSLKAMLDIAQVLTPEQRAQAAQHLKQHEERREQRHAHRHGPRAEGAASAPSAPHH